MMSWESLQVGVACLLLLAVPVRSAVAEPAPGEAWGVSLGGRAVLGGLFEEEGGRFGGGGNLWSALTFNKAWELELGLAAVKASGRSTLGVAEVLGRYVLESEAPVEASLGLGPVLSIDFGGRRGLSGGLVVGSGLRYFPRRTELGATLDLFYRLLFEESQVEHVLTAGVGLVYRL